MVEPAVVWQIRVLSGRGRSAKRISREFGIARNMVSRYVRGGMAAEQQTRLRRHRLDEACQVEARARSGVSRTESFAVQR